MHDPIDEHIGRKIRAQRKLMRWTQAKLGQALGVTFQQCAKYECGQSRVSASTLFQICRALGVEPSFFYEGLA